MPPSTPSAASVVPPSETVRETAFAFVLVTASLPTTNSFRNRSVFYVEGASQSDAGARSTPPGYQGSARPSVRIWGGLEGG